MQFDHLVDIIRQHLKEPDNIAKYLWGSRSRIEYTLEILRGFEIRKKPVCEIGFGAIGLACHLELGALVEAYDCEETYKPVCRKLNIPWHYLDLNRKNNRTIDQYYDIVILCEVLEHLSRSPIEVLGELRRWIKPGGCLLLSTPNLVRLTNRLRLLVGREIFEHFVQDKLIVGHFREYTLEEIQYYLELAGYVEISLNFFCERDVPSRPLLYGISYRWLCRLFPRLSQLIFASARNPL